MFNVDTDTSQVETGTWGTFRGSQFLIAHTSSLKFQKCLARHQAPYRKQIEQGKLDPETNRTVICKSMSEGIVLDWKDVVDGQKNQVPYSSAAAAKALLRDTEFREWVSDFSMNLTNFLADEAEEVGES